LVHLPSHIPGGQNPITDPFTATLVDDQGYKINDRVYINTSVLKYSSPADSTHPALDIHPKRSEVVGHILEIRAKSSEHVYCRVYLMRAAEGSKMNADGAREWVATDTMVVVAAASVLGRAKIEWSMLEDGEGIWVEKVEL